MMQILMATFLANLIFGFSGLHQPLHLQLKNKQGIFRSSMKLCKQIVEKYLLPSLPGGVARNLFFSLLGGRNYANLFKNLIKFQIFDEKLGTIGGLGPWASPVVMPLLTPFQNLHRLARSHSCRLQTPSRSQNGDNVARHIYMKKTRLTG